MPETRIFPDTFPRIEQRGKAVVIRGVAVPYNKWTVLFENEDFIVREVVRPGVFDRTLSEGRGVVSTFNHDVNFMLGSWPGPTLRLIDTADGMSNVILPPDTNTLRDLLFEPMRRGTIGGQSFMFDLYPGGERVTKRRAKDGRKLQLRELLSVKLYELGPVSMPAYAQSTVDLAERLRRQVHAPE